MGVCESISSDSSSKSRSHKYDYDWNVCSNCRHCFSEKTKVTYCDGWCNREWKYYEGNYGEGYWTNGACGGHSETKNSCNCS